MCVNQNYVELRAGGKETTNFTITLAWHSVIFHSHLYTDFTDFL